MRDNIKIIFTFSDEIQTELHANDIDFFQELLKKQPELSIQYREHPKKAEGERNVVEVITATAALAPLIVPIAKEFIKRLLPHEKITEKEVVHPDGTIESSYSIERR